VFYTTKTHYQDLVKVNFVLYIADRISVYIGKLFLLCCTVQRVYASTMRVFDPISFYCQIMTSLGTTVWNFTMDA